MVAELDRRIKTMAHDNAAFPYSLRLTTFGCSVPESPEDSIAWAARAC